MGAEAERSAFGGPTYLRFVIALPPLDRAGVPGKLLNLLHTATFSKIW